MEKLFYVLWPPADIDPAAWSARLLAMPAALQAAGAAQVRVGVPDVPLPENDPYTRMRDAAPAGFVSLWLHSAQVRQQCEAIVQAAATRLAGYAVAESTVLPDTALACGAREDGFLQVCAFAALPGLPRADLWDCWLVRHGVVAVETQSTRFYNQNIVVRALTPGAPAWDAIVEERFPAMALNRRDVYFAAEGDPERMARNMARMAESCAAFIDFSTITLMNCGEYRFAGGAEPAFQARANR